MPDHPELDRTGLCRSLLQSVDTASPDQHRRASQQISTSGHQPWENCSINTAILTRGAVHSFGIVTTEIEGDKEWKTCVCAIFIYFPLSNKERRKRRKKEHVTPRLSQLRSNGQMQKVGVTSYKACCLGSHCVCLNKWLEVLKLMHTRVHTIDRINTLTFQPEANGMIITWKEYECNLFLCPSCSQPLNYILTL